MDKMVQYNDNDQQIVWVKLSLWPEKVLNQNLKQCRGRLKEITNYTAAIVKQEKHRFTEQQIDRFFERRCEDLKTQPTGSNA